MDDKILIQVSPRLLKFLSLALRIDIEPTNHGLLLLGFGRNHHIQVSCLDFGMTNFLVSLVSVLTSSNVTLYIKMFHE